MALKIAVNTWYAIPPSEEERKAVYLGVAEGLRWIEWGTQAYYRMLSGGVSLTFGVAIVKSTVLARWIGAVGIAAGVFWIAAGVEVAYVGFASVNVGLGVISKIIYYIWIGILGAFRWTKTREKKMITG